MIFSECFVYFFIQNEIALRPESRESSVSPTRITSPTRTPSLEIIRAKSCRTVSKSLSFPTSPSTSRKQSFCRSETFTNALINRYDSDAEEEEDKEAKIRNLKKSLKRQEKLVKELQRKLKQTI